MTFLGVQVQQLGAFHVFNLSEYAYELFDIMAIIRTEIAYVHAFENILLVRDGTLEGIGKALKAVLPGIVHQSFSV